ncbi:MAG: DNA-binding protein [Thermoprotei archaeon]|nr:DNA-binding protein [Thermoprotei archaeon]
MIASIDTCFLIDWSRYRARKLMEKVFDYVFVTEEVLDETRTERTIEYVSNLLAKGFLVIYPFKSELLSLVRRILEISTSDPRIPALDPPEAYAFAIAWREKCICLTENKGILRLVEYYEEFREIKVWRSLELIEYLYEKGLIKDLEEGLKEYSEDTGHVFPKKRPSQKNGAQGGAYPGR